MEVAIQPMSAATDPVAGVSGQTLTFATPMASNHHCCLWGVATF